ncbi:acetyl-CoA carboxylase biotin carboxyl carrier protein subunit [Aequorivita echinoideorum]|uniref:Acetyl-CoA carboxylase biotin carboxyl carrier protein subunit n=1 Tax=Aequorivita echinoideorum TaxID=1549647 RepID=A0ABS5SBE9_9FLAO|nr:acetyl-CoA carboxylase biotin carboxyl carrier protein subunit [Aequorivita echinoideorum]MBT0609190.1 acetyl-CoA carboxylase biotin carboxyl carrier protein subunit [Aequorivita echinoideorum]
MEEKFNAVVNETFDFQLTKEDLQNLDIVSEKKSANVIYNNKSLEIEILESNFHQKKYTLKINGNLYKVKIENALDALIAEMGLSLGNASAADEIHAPMPGLILEVNVAEGDSVKKGDYVCVLEAMKMENALTAPRDGKVKSVTISKGDTVDKGMLLIEFEKEND